MKKTTSTLLSLGVSVSLIALGVWLLYDHSMGGWSENGRWMMGHHGHMGGGMGIVMIVFWIFLFGAIGLLISGAVNGIRGAKHHQDSVRNPIETLKQRYAQGKIDKAEFENKRRDLSL